MRRDGLGWRRMGWAGDEMSLGTLMQIFRRVWRVGLGQLLECLIDRLAIRLVD